MVKDNQPTLKENIQKFFEEPVGEVFSEKTTELNGGRIEVRKMEASEGLNEYLDWPGVKQVCRIERTREPAGNALGKAEHEVAYAITSLSAKEASAKELLELSRGHWGIENRLHYVRDVTMGEDASRVRQGQEPQVMAALRNTVIGALHLEGVKNIAAALRRFAAHPLEALALIGVKLILN